jgi:hypothetical protein
MIVSQRLKHTLLWSRAFFALSQSILTQHPVLSTRACRVSTGVLSIYTPSSVATTLSLTRPLSVLSESEIARFPASRAIDHTERSTPTRGQRVQMSDARRTILTPIITRRSHPLLAPTAAPAAAVGHQLRAAEKAEAEVCIGQAGGRRERGEDRQERESAQKTTLSTDKQAHVPARAAKGRSSVLRIALKMELPRPFADENRVPNSSSMRFRQIDTRTKFTSMQSQLTYS